MQRADARPLAGRRILLVEDEYLIAMEVKRWLLSASAEVVGPVPSLARALDLIEDGGLDAAVLDVNLGNGGTVYPVADKLSALGVPCDIWIGSLDAKVTFIEYAAVTCTHCGTFHGEVWPGMKARWIDTGRMRFAVHRPEFRATG